MSASFEVSLKDDVSGPAKPAMVAVGGLSAAFDQLQQKMRDFDDQWGAIQRRNLAFHDQAAYKTPSGKSILEDVKRQQEAALGGHDQNRDAMEGLKKMRETQAAAELAGKSAQQTSQWFGDLQKASKTADDNILGFRTQIVGLVQDLAPVVAVVTAIIAGLGQLAMMAIQFTQEKDALRNTFDVFTGGGGQKLLDELEDMASQLPFTADKLNAWAKSLLAAGIQGDALKTGIKAIASATAIMGESGGAAAEGLIKRFAALAASGQKVKLDRRLLPQLAEAGVTVQALAAALGVAPEKLGDMELSADRLGAALQKALIAKGATPLAQMGQTFSSIGAKLRESFEDAFEDLGDLVHPFMAELQSLASEFFAGGIASTSFKDTIKNVMRVVFEVGTRSVRALHLVFLELEVAFLKTKIAVKPLTSALDKLGISGGIVNVIMYLVAGTAIVLAVVFGLLAVAVLLASLPFIILVVAIAAVVYGISWLIGHIEEGMQYLWNLGMAGKQAGSDLINGLGNAIASGTAWVVGLITDLAASIIGAIVGPLKIHSPSRVMMGLGRHVTGGLAGGIEAGQDDVLRAATGAGGAAVAGAAGGASGGASGGSLTINVEAGAVVINGAGGDVLKLTREALALLLEEAALQVGIA